jgi:WD40 repeat protein
MAWPVSQDYNEAIQSPAANFADPDLRGGLAAINALGLPMPYSGNFADVYQVSGPNGRWAVKCFTRQAAGLRERYVEISKHLRQAKLPFTVDFTYLERGIRVAGTWYPALKMQWVEGLTFNEFVRQHLDKPAMLEGLLQIWGRMAKYLRASGAAHCDLQHGNVLLVPGSGANSLAIKLIDYDGMYVPGLAGSKSGEVGHPSYQHPQRLRDGTYSLEVDRFPLLLIATALRAVQTAGRSLWDKYDNGDNLLFRESDLREPERSELFQELPQLGDPTTAALTAALRKSLQGRLESAPLLEEVLPDGRSAPALARAARPSATPPSIPTAASVAAAPPARPPDDVDDFSTEETELPKARRKPRKKAKAGIPVKVWVGASAAVAGLALILCGGGAGAVYLATRNSPDKLAHASTPAQIQPDTVVPTGPGVTPPRTNPAKPPDKDVPKDGSTDKPVETADGVKKLRSMTVRLLHTVPSPHKELPSGVHIAQDGSRAVSADISGTVAIWTMGDPPKYVVPKEPRLAKAWVADISPDGKHLLTNSDRLSQITLWNADTMTEEAKLTPDGKFVSDCLLFSPDGNSCLAFIRGQEIAVWDLKTRKQTLLAGSDRMGITRACFLPDSRRILSFGHLGQDSTIRLWDAATGEVLRMRAAPKLAAASFGISADGKRVVLASRDKRLYLLDAETLEEQYASAELLDGGPQSIAVSSEGFVVGTGSDRGRSHMWLWDLATGQELRRLDGPDYFGSYLSFSADGRTLVGAWGGNGVLNLRVWKIEGLDARPPDSVDIKPPGTDGSTITDPPRKPLPPLVLNFGPKPDVPKPDAMTAARSALKKDYAAEYARQKPEEKRDFAEKLLHLGLAPQTPPASRWVAFSEARALAAAAGDLKVSLRAADELANRFDDTSAVDMRAVALASAGATASTPALRKEIACYALSVADDAVEDDNYARADQMATLAQNCLDKSQDTTLAAAAQARVQEVAELKKVFLDAGKTWSAEVPKADDPAHNLAMGKFYALQRGDWERGLPLLRKGSDPKLKALAERDWTIKGDSKAMETLADDYAALGKRESGRAKTNLGWRACYWYEGALVHRSGPDRDPLVRKASELQRDLPTLRPVILQAWYAASTSSVNLIENIRFRLLQSPAGTKEWTIRPDEFVDPAPAEEKTFVVVYRYAGWVQLNIMAPSPDGTSKPKFYFAPALRSAQADAFRPAPGQELHILDASLCKGGLGRSFTAKAQALVKGATLKATLADLGFDPALRDQKQVYVIVYHDGAKVQLRIIPTKQDINIGADSADTKPPVTESPIVEDKPRKPLPALVKHYGPKAAVPDDAALAAAEKALKKEHEADYARSKPEDVRALAEKLLLHGLATQTPLTSRYIAFREARDLAGSVGDLLVGLRAADELENRFKVRLAETKAPVLEKASAVAPSAAVRTQLAFYAWANADDAIEDDDYATADRLMKVAQAMVEKEAVSPLADSIQAQAKEIAELRKAYDGVADAVRTRAAKPNDPDANLALGKFYALEKGDWERGLPLLKRGNDAKLKPLAESDWTMGKDTKQMEALADRYAEQGKSETGKAKTNLLLRACYWYNRSQFGRSGEEQNAILAKSHAIDGTLPPQRPIVLYAWYGAFATWLNVTDNIRLRLVQNPAQTKELKISPQELGGDPSPGEEKTLFVVYRYRGWVHLDTKPLISETPGGKPDKFIFVPVTTAALSDSFRPTAGQELHILHASLVKGGQAQFFGNKAQAQVKGTTLKAKAADIGFNANVRNDHQAYVIVYHDGNRVQLFMAPCNQDINIAAATSDTKPPGTESPVVSDPPPVVKKPSNKLPVPDAGALEAAEKEVKDGFKDSYSQATTPAKMHALAHTLLASITNDAKLKEKPATHYVLLRESRDLAAKAGYLELSLQTAGSMADLFAVNAADMKAAALQLANNASPNGTVHLNIASYALSAVDDAVEDDDYAVAERLIKIAQASAPQARHPKPEPVAAVKAAVTSRAQEVAALHKAYDAVKATIRTLADKPDDPDANLAVGKFYALEKGDWLRGLPLLRRGGDAKLKALAETDGDLESKYDAGATEALGDRYTTHAGSASGTAKSNLLVRACYWYNRARFTAGQDHEPALLKRVQDIEKNLPKPRVVILDARYGDYKGWLDVTDKLRERLAQQPLGNWPLQIPTGEFGNDPAPGQDKVLFAVYRYKGSVFLGVSPPVREAAGGDSNSIQFVPNAVFSKLQPLSPGQKLHILDAVLYNASGWNGFANAVQPRVKGAHLQAKLTDFGFDPMARDKNKACAILYYDGHKVGLNVTGADEEIKIGPEPGNP